MALKSLIGWDFSVAGTVDFDPRSFSFINQTYQDRKKHCGYCRNFFRSWKSKIKKDRWLYSSIFKYYLLEPFVARFILFGSWTGTCNWTVCVSFEKLGLVESVWAEVDNFGTSWRERIDSIVLISDRKSFNWSSSSLILS